MKITTLVFLIMTSFIGTQLYGQVVSEFVDFNTYVDSTHNDLATKFASNVGGFTQDTANGITGGSLAVHAPGSFAQAYYCHQYLNGVGQITNTSICFRYDSASVNRNTSAAAAGIELVGGNNINTTVGWVTAGGPANWLNIYTGTWVYSNTGNPAITLMDQHWYKLQLSTNIIGGAFGDQIYIADTVFDLGLTGLTTPAFVKADTGTVYELNYVNTPSIQVKIGAGNWGGGNHVDNFSFQGTRSADTCVALNTGINDVSELGNISVYPNPFSSTVTVDYSFFQKQGDPRLVIRDMLGRNLKTIQLTDQFDKITISTSDLPAGTLLFTLLGDFNAPVNKKVVKVD